MAAGVAFAVAPGAAHALGPIGVEVGALVGGGTNPSYPPSFLGFGAGGRAGLSIVGVYLGASVVDYVGSSIPIGKDNVVDSAHALLVGGQGGYTFRLGVLRLRPLLELGVAEITEAGSTAPAFYLQPGFTLLVPIGPIYVGLDLNGLLIPSHAQAGVAF
jgi:hypothetical protein